MLSGTCYNFLAAIFLIVHQISALDVKNQEMEELLEFVGHQPISVQIPRQGTKNLSISKGDCTMMEYEEGDELVTIKICRRKLLVTSDHQQQSSSSPSPSENSDDDDQESSSEGSTSDSEDCKQESAILVE